MIQHWMALALFFTTLFQTVRPEEPNNVFEMPGAPGKEGDYTENRIYKEREDMYISWWTDFPEIKLSLRHEATTEDLAPVPFVALYGSKNETARHGSYITSLFLGSHNIEKNGPVFTLIISNLDDSERWFRSHYFNITRGSDPFGLTASLPAIASSSDPNPHSAASSIVSPVASFIIASTTGATRSAFESSLATLSTLTATNSASDDTATADSATLDKSRMTTSAKIGIGVGISIGALGFTIGTLGLYMMKKSRKRTSELEISSPIRPQTEQSADCKHFGDHGDGPDAQGPVELDAGAWARELPAENIMMPQELPGEGLTSPREMPAEELKASPRDISVEDLESRNRNVGIAE